MNLYALNICAIYDDILNRHPNILTIILLLIFQYILEKNIKDGHYLVKTGMFVVIIKNISDLYCK